MKKQLLSAAITMLLVMIIQLNADAAFMPKQKDTVNMLTKEEKAAGWILLFDGKNTNGWRTYQNKPQTSWYVSNRVLGCKYDTSQTYQHADLITDKQYTNF